MQKACTTTNRTKGRDEGFTVAEFLAAATILLIVLIGVLGAVQFAGAATRQASAREAAIDVATHQIELARNLPWASLGVDYGGGVKGSPPGTIPAIITTTTVQGSFTITNLVTWDMAKDTGLHKTKKMKVTVTWSDPAPGGSVSVETKVYGQGGSANSGDILIKACDADTPSIRVPGIQITLDPATGSSMMVASDSNGEAYFGDVPLGTASVAATSADYLCDVTPFQNMTIASGFEDKGFMQCQKVSQATIKVVGGSGQPLQGASVVLVDPDPAHSSTRTLITGLDGTVTFDRLWKSPSAYPYTVTATYSGYSSATTFLVTAGGQTINKTLTVVAPSVITVLVKDASTGNLITGTNATIAVTNQGTGTQLPGSPSTVTTGTAVFAISASGNYNVSVTGVAGYSDSPTNVISATYGAGSNNVTILMSAKTQLKVWVKRSTGTAIVGVPVTVLNPSGTALASDDGLNPGITDASGLETWTILASGNHTISTVVNGITYYTSPSPVSLLTGQSTPYSQTITITTGSIKVTTSGYSSSTRLLTIWDVDNNLVYSSQVSATSTTISGLVPGSYTVSLYSKNITTASPAYPSAGGTSRRDKAATVTSGGSTAVSISPFN